MVEETTKSDVPEGEAEEQEIEDPMAKLGGEEEAPAKEDEGDEQEAKDEGDERPEWLPKKFKTAEDLAKGYDNAVKRLSKQDAELKSLREKDIDESGVPEEEEGYYAGDVEETFRKEGVNDSMLADMRKMAKAAGLTNEQAAKLLKYSHEVDQALATADPTKVLSEVAQKLGKNGKGVVDDMTTWIGKRVKAGIIPRATAEQFFREMTPETATVFSKMQASVKGHAPPSVKSGDDALTADDIREMHANPLYKTSKSYRRKVEKAWEDYHARAA